MSGCVGTRSLWVSGLCPFPAGGGIGIGKRVGIIKAAGTIFAASPLGTITAIGITGFCNFNMGSRKFVDKTGRNGVLP